MICVGAPKSKNHKYGVTRYTTKKGKIYVYIVPKCRNCKSNHQAMVFKCLAK